TAARSAPRGADTESALEVALPAGEQAAEGGDAVRVEPAVGQPVVQGAAAVQVGAVVRALGHRVHQVGEGRHQVVGGDVGQPEAAHPRGVDDPAVVEFLPADGALAGRAQLFQAL